MARYAEGTSVAVERTRNELEKELRRFGATSFAYGWDEAADQQVIQFGMSGRMVRMEVPLPKRDDPLFTSTAAGRARTKAAAEEAYDKEIRRRWRSLLMVTKAKLVAVHDGITSLEREFLADMVTEDGRTVAEVAAPWLAGTGRLSIGR